MHELSPQIAKIVKTAYLLLPLGLASLAGLCLLVAAMRKALTGGAALALGGLAGVIVVGSLSLGAHNLSAGTKPATASMTEAATSESVTAVAVTTSASTASVTVETQAAAAEVSPSILKAATIGYALLPLALAVLAGLSLLIMTFGKTLDGPSALALGGLAGVVVIGSVFSLRGPGGDPIHPLVPAVSGWSGGGKLVVVSGDSTAPRVATDTNSTTPVAAVAAVTRDELEQFKQELTTAMAGLDANALDLKNQVGALGGDATKQAAEAQAQLKTIGAGLAALQTKVEAAEGGVANATEAAKAAADAASGAARAAASAQSAADAAAMAAAQALEKASEKAKPAPAPATEPGPAAGDGG